MKLASGILANILCGLALIPATLHALPFIEPNFPGNSWVAVARGGEDAIIRGLRQQADLKFIVVEENPELARQQIYKENEDLLGPTASFDSVQSVVKYFSDSRPEMEAFERSPGGRSANIWGSDFLLLPSRSTATPYPGYRTRYNRLSGLRRDFVILVMPNYDRFQLIEEAAHYFNFTVRPRSRRALNSFELSRASAWRELMRMSLRYRDSVSRWDRMRPPSGTAYSAITRYLRAASLQLEFARATYGEEIGVALLMRENATALGLADRASQERISAQLRRNAALLRGRVLSPLMSDSIYRVLQGAPLNERSATTWNEVSQALREAERAASLAESSRAVEAPTPSSSSGLRPSSSLDDDF